jgi:hypothetical protein
VRRSAATKLVRIATTLSSSHRCFFSPSHLLPSLLPRGGDLRWYASLITPNIRDILVFSTPPS